MHDLKTVTFILFTLEKSEFDEFDKTDVVEFDFMIGHVLLIITYL